MASPFPNPAYRIRSERLLLRCWEPADAEPLLASLAANCDYLAEWMPWAANEPTPLDDKLEYLRQCRARFDGGEDFIYGVFDSVSEALLGGAGLHTRCGPGGLEVGYWIDQAHTRRGLATETAAALTRAGFEVFDVSRIEIRIEPGNTGSLRIPEKLGFEHEGTLRKRVQTARGWADVDSFVLTDLSYVTSPAVRYPVEAWDALGRELMS